MYEEGFFDDEEGLIDEHALAGTRNETEPEEKEDEKLFACNSVPATGTSITRTQQSTPTASIVEYMHMRIATEASLKEGQRTQEFSSSELLQEADDEGILEEETQYNREILQTGKDFDNF